MKHWWIVYLAAAFTVEIGWWDGWYNARHDSYQGAFILPSMLLFMAFANFLQRNDK